MVGEILNKKINFKYVDDRLGHDRRYSLNSNKFILEFGGIQKIKLKDWMNKILN